jgi:hypothetical protein
MIGMLGGQGGMPSINALMAGMGGMRMPQPQDGTVMSARPTFKSLSRDVQPFGRQVHSQIGSRTRCGSSLVSGRRSSMSKKPPRSFETSS